MALLRALVDKLLTDVSNGIFQELTAFGAERFLTPKGVTQRSGILGFYGTQHLRVHANAMGGRGEAPRVTLLQPDLSHKYIVQAHGLEEVVTVEDYEDFEIPFEAEQDKTILLTYANLVAKEYALATAMGSAAGTITQNTTLTGTSQWNDYANSDPIGVWKTARQTVRDNSGFWPNTALMESDVSEALSFHPQIWDRLGFKYNQAGQLTQDNLQSAMKVKTLIVVESVYDSSSQGQTSVVTPVWPKEMFYAVVQSNAALRQKTFGYNVFMKQEGIRTVFKQPIVNPPGSTSIICKDSYDQLLSDVTCAYAVYGAIA